MSAVRDQSQNTTFIFSNFYHIYRKGKLAAQAKKELATGVVLKSNSLTETPMMNTKVVTASSSKEQLDELAAWSHSDLQAGKREIANHLRTLRDARKRLDYLMTEIDEILKRS